MKNSSCNKKWKKEENKRVEQKKNFTLREQLRILAGLFSFTKPFWLPFLAAIIGMAIVSSINAYLPVVIQRYIDEYLTVNNVALGATIRMSLFYLSFVVVKMIVVYVKDYCFKIASEKTVASMRNQVYHKVVHLGMRYFDQTPNGSVVSRVTNDTETIKEFWNVFLTFLDGFLNAITIGVAMFSLNTNLAWLFMAFVPFIIVLIYIYQKYSTLIYGRMREALGHLNAKLSESIMGMNIIQHFNQEERVKSEFDDVNQQYVAARNNMFKMNALLLMPAINLIEAIALFIVLWIFGLRHLEGLAVDIGIVYAFTSYAKSFFHPIGNMLDSLSVFQDGLVSGARVVSLLDRDDMAPSAGLNANGSITEGKIAIQDLSFSYDQEKEILQNITISAEPGQTIALVGQTGSGKSSIINVLMRFYEFSKGDVLIDGQSIHDIPVEKLRERMGLVLQDSFMFYGDIADNIRLHGDYSDEEVRQAAEFVNADSFIEELEGGYHAKVIEGGATFSTGEKQLLSFARTILRDPKILILDEATANIDTETEKKIQKGLENMRRGRTTIIIAHRLSTIRDADKIYVLRHGKIIEEGNHESLIDRQGVYHDMYQLQTFQENS
ncbi:ABC transporter ATP-binding protein [Desemzia sp. RIT804]|uniref:ABC transporter ATP-binding protein n=1 Tax=Desemzia sp. RIT 804 TaxID=2810209 RepID=UPI001951B2BF|nr:ABC transporter ATP-binding protein [Desemzia sp. RIT 804]MBM6615697.1 ABC transporter ATP-binding protein [Desemzia sp. RIT 804]